MPPTDSLRQAMEAALLANPDDLATHMAYADHLVELGDPRGGFIQVQLALEAPGRGPGERDRLRTRERELLALHLKEWLGEAADAFLAEDQLALTSMGETTEALAQRFGFDPAYWHAFIPGSFKF